VTLREAVSGDLPALLSLYLHLHEDRLPEDTAPHERAWAQIMADENHHVILCEIDGALVSSCVCAVIPNLTRWARPYALIENVVTRAGFRRRGCASACLQRAADIARAAGCYKIMLLTGAKDEATLNFYRRAGFNDADKTAFIQWLK
jgi:GNAT superfamily N-acetyltransferase